MVDKTGLDGEYDFTLNWDEDEGPTLRTAVEEQLGLKLEPQKVPVSVFVIESARKPSANKTGVCASHIDSSPESSPSLE